MINTLYRSSDGQKHAGLGIDAIRAALDDTGGLLWIDLAAEPDENCRALFRDPFDFHPLAIADALEETHVPKVDDWGRYLTVTLHAVKFDPGGEEPVDTLELDVFLGPNYVVTYHRQPIAALDEVGALVQRDERRLQQGPARLLYLLIDELIADYMPVIEQIDEKVDRIEDEIFDDPKPTILERMFTLKRGLLLLRRILAPQREVINKLARGDFAIIGSGDRIFFRDVYDHVVRLYDITEGMRDLVSGALDTYLSVVNNRMNDVMKTLTMITTLFLPISFLVGFFGTNFFRPVAPLGAWTSLTAFGIMFVLMALVPILMYLWMRRRRWM
jgi:magnesium transporter